MQAILPVLASSTWNVLDRDSGSMDKKALGEKIKELRKAGGFSQRSFAEKSGVAYATLQDIEGGQSNPTVDTLEAIGRLLGVPIVQLFNVAEGGKLPAEYATSKALKGLKQLSTGKKKRSDAQMLSARGKRLEPKIPPSLASALAFLEKFEGLSPERKALVSTFLYDDESYLADYPALAQSLVVLLKG